MWTSKGFVAAGKLKGAPQSLVKCCGGYDRCGWSVLIATLIVDTSAFSQPAHCVNHLHNGGVGHNIFIASIVFFEYCINVCFKITQREHVKGSKCAWSQNTRTL